MAKAVGEAKFDNAARKWYFVVWMGENGAILSQSDPVFDSQKAAEDALIEALNGLADIASANGDI